MNLDAWVYQGRGAEERKTKKRRPPAKIANRLQPHLTRWRKIDVARWAELRDLGLMEAGEVVNRTHDGAPLAGKRGQLGKASWKTPGLARTWSGIRCGVLRRLG